jgi:hypothetical protein
LAVYHSRESDDAGGGKADRNGAGNFKFQMALLTSPEAAEFLRVGTTACCLARPCNACENVAYLHRRYAIRHPPYSIAVENPHDVNKAI